MEIKFTLIGKKITSCNLLEGNVVAIEFEDEGSIESLDTSIYLKNFLKKMGINHLDDFKKHTREEFMGKRSMAPRTKLRHDFGELIRSAKIKFADE